MCYQLQHPASLLSPCSSSRSSSSGSIYGAPPIPSLPPDCSSPWCWVEETFPTPPPRSQILNTLSSYHLPDHHQHFINLGHPPVHLSGTPTEIIRKSAQFSIKMKVLILACLFSVLLVTYTNANFYGKRGKRLYPSSFSSNISCKINDMLHFSYIPWKFHTLMLSVSKWLHCNNSLWALCCPMDFCQN